MLTNIQFFVADFTAAGGGENYVRFLIEEVYILLFGLFLLNFSDGYFLFKLNYSK